MKIRSILACIGLAACIKSPDSIAPLVGSGNLIGIPSIYSIKHTLEFKEEILRPDDSIAFTTYATDTFDRKPDDVSIYLYNLKSTECTPELTGVSQRSIVEMRRGIKWGRVDAYDGYGQEGWEPPFNLDEVKCLADINNTAGSTYVLCAEKGLNTALVCINQITDNPQMAEEIFSSFRWVD